MHFFPSSDDSSTWLFNHAGTEGQVSPGLEGSGEEEAASWRPSHHCGVKGSPRAPPPLSLHPASPPQTGLAPFSQLPSTWLVKSIRVLISVSLDPVVAGKHSKERRVTLAHQRCLAILPYFHDTLRGPSPLT